MVKFKDEYSDKANKCHRIKNLISHLFIECPELMNEFKNMNIKQFSMIKNVYYRMFDQNLKRELEMELSTLQFLILIERININSKFGLKHYARLKFLNLKRRFKIKWRKESNFCI